MSADNQQERLGLRYSPKQVAKMMKVYGDLIATSYSVSLERSSENGSLVRMRDEKLPYYRKIVPQEVRVVLESIDSTVRRMEEEIDLRRLPRKS